MFQKFAVSFSVSCEPKAFFIGSQARSFVKEDTLRKSGHKISKKVGHQSALASLCFFVYDPAASVKEVAIFLQ